jgi:glycosyltransferase involved in cell wall biosynthesis
MADLWSYEVSLWMNEEQVSSSSTSSLADSPAPLVSIGMPVYNGAKYIHGALDALLKQTYAHFELIISDNASTDETGAICQELAQKDARIRYIRQEKNIGIIPNFHYVLSEAEGKYFMWAAHDDRWDPRFLERTLAVLERDSTCGLAFSNYIVRNLDSGTETKYEVSSSESKSAIFNYLTQIIKMRPSLIYGLFRFDKIKDKRLAGFDYSDVHLLSELAIESSIRVVDDYLYIAGERGTRIPFSMTHKKIDRKTFMGKQYELLRKNFSFPIPQFLFLLLCGIMAINKIRLWRY